MTLLAELRSEFYDDKSLYDIIKDSYYHNLDQDVSLQILEKLISLNWQGKPNTRGGRLEKWCKIIGIDENVFDHCQDCDTLDFQDEMRMAYEDYLVCQTCCDDNYTYSQYRDTYVSHEDADEDDYDEDYRDDYVCSYDYDVMDDLSMTSTKEDTLQPNTAYYGIELEVEKRSNANETTAERIHRSFTYDDIGQFALLKSDGSLSNGFEIVTAPGTLNAHKKYWDKFFKSEAIKEVKSWNTDTTGMHIHISRTAITNLEQGKILLFINAKKNEEFVNHIAGRSSDQWAKKSDKKITDCLQSSDKYEAVNTSHRNTIELRIFKGNLARLGFYRVLEFVDALVSWSKNTSIAKLSYLDFLKYMEKPEIRSQYPIFYGWLTRKSYCVGTPSRKIDWSDELNNLKETE